MRKLLLAAGAAATVLAGVLLFQPPSTSRAATTAIKLTNVTFKEFTRNNAGAIVSVTVTKEAIGAEPVEYTFKAVSSSRYYDRHMNALKGKYFVIGDKVSVWGTNSKEGNLTKIVNLSVWKVTLTGTVSSPNVVSALGFDFTVSKLIAEIGRNATYTMSVSGASETVIQQYEVHKAGTTTTRTLKTRTWEDVRSGQRVQVTGFWTSHNFFLDATKVLLPSISV